ncbi:MAG TPA: mechanosensitive ion channel family protein [Ktedonobacterales bacterium]|jgi:small-conductance mechanosensitive channel|nr:mechanosensitive ion channel family protein [Ktedonobacterales bacterium]
MEQMKILATLNAITAANLLMAWIVPVAIVAALTVLGWLAERLVTRWAMNLAHHANHRESLVARALRGHITFWGFLLGVGIATNTLNLTKVWAGHPADEWIHNALLALFVVSLTIMIAGVITGLIFAASATTSRPVVSLVTNLTRFAVLAIGFMLVMAIFGITITPYLTTLGIVGLAVSLAVQATLTDLVSGMLLLAARQITIGEYVKLSTGEEGYVQDIAWRTTTIRQPTDTVVIVPNSKMTSLPVTNYHANTDPRAVSVDLGVSYGSDLDQVERVTVEVAEDVMRTVKGAVSDFEPTVRFHALGDYSISLTVNMQAQASADQNLITHEFIKRVRRRYREEGISIPYPIQAVQLRETPAQGAHDGQDGRQDSHQDSHDGQADSATGQRGAQASANSNDASSR